MSDVPPTADPNLRSTPSGWAQFLKAVAKGFFVVGGMGMGLTAGPIVLAAVGGSTIRAYPADLGILLYPAMPIITLFKAIHVPYTTAGLVLYWLSPILGYGLIGAIIGSLYWFSTRRK